MRRWRQTTRRQWRTAADACDLQVEAFPPFARREDSALPFDPAAIPPAVPAVFDTNFYTFGAGGKLPDDVRKFAAARQSLHCGVALAELSVSLGMLDPSHPATQRNRAAILEVLAAIDLAACVTPSPLPA